MFCQPPLPFTIFFNRQKRFLESIFSSYTSETKYDSRLRWLFGTVLVLRHAFVGGTILYLLRHSFLYEVCNCNIGATWQLTPPPPWRPVTQYLNGLLKQKTRKIWGRWPINRRAQNQSTWWKQESRKLSTVNNMNRWYNKQQTPAVGLWSFTFVT